MSDRGDYKEPTAGQWMVVVHPYDGDVACMKVDRVDGLIAYLSDGSAWGVETSAPLSREWRGHYLWQADPVYLASDIDRLTDSASHETMCEVFALLLSRRPR